MKPTILRNVAALCLMVLGRGYADTVTVFTKTGHASINGHLVKMAEGTITLEAGYASGMVTRVIPLSTVESIEFNSTTFNSGPPSKGSGSRPGRWISGASCDRQAGCAFRCARTPRRRRRAPAVQGREHRREHDSLRTGV